MSEHQNIDQSNSKPPAIFHCKTIISPTNYVKLISSEGDNPIQIAEVPRYNKQPIQVIQYNPSQPDQFEGLIINIDQEIKMFQQCRQHLQTIDDDISEEDSERLVALLSMQTEIQNFLQEEKDEKEKDEKENTE